MNNFLFGTGKGDYGLTDFQLNLVKVCVEDQEFFDENWESINPNEFNDPDTRYFLSILREMKIHNAKISYPTLLLIINNRGNDYAYVQNIYAEIIEELKKRKLTEEEVENIKKTYKYFNLYSSMAVLGNTIIEWAKEGYKYGDEVISKYNKLSPMIDRMNNAAAKLISDLGDGVNRNRSINNDWNE